MSKGLQIMSVLLLLSWFSARAVDPVPAGMVELLVGEVEVVRGDKKVSLAKDAEVYFGETLTTAKDSRATILLKSGHKLFVFQSSQCTIKENESRKGTHVEHDAGSIWFKVKKLGQEETFTVKMPVAVAGVRGTGFISNIINEQVNSLCVCEGSVEVESRGNKVMVPAGMGIKLMRDLPPGLPHDNKDFIKKKRRLEQMPSCVNCHSGTYGDTSLFETFIKDMKTIEKSDLQRKRGGN